MVSQEARAYQEIDTSLNGVLKCCQYTLQGLQIHANIFTEQKFVMQCYGVPWTQCTYSLTFVLSIHEQMQAYKPGFKALGIATPLSLRQILRACLRALDIETWDNLK